MCIQSCSTLYDPMDSSLAGASVHGIYQARTLKWAAISYSRGPSWPRDWTQGLNPGLLCLLHWQVYIYFLPLGHLGGSLFRKHGAKWEIIKFQIITGAKSKKP